MYSDDIGHYTIVYLQNAHADPTWRSRLNSATEHKALDLSPTVVSVHFNSASERNSRKTMRCDLVKRKMYICVEREGQGLAATTYRQRNYRDTKISPANVLLEVVTALTLCKHTRCPEMTARISYPHINHTVYASLFT